MNASKNISQKRILKALAGEPLDRPPFWFMRQAGRYLDEYRQVRAEAGNFLNLCYSPEKAEEVTLQPIRRYGMDAAIMFSDILVIPDALGQKLDYLEGEGPVLEPVGSTADLARLSMDRLHTHLAPVYETLRRLSQSLPGDVGLIGFAGAPWTVATYMVEGRGSRDHAIIKQWAYGDPVGFGQLISLLVEATSEYLIAQVKAGAEILQIFDTWAGVLPEPVFHQWVIEPTRQIVAAVKKACPDVPIIGFPRGAGPLYPVYISQTGVDAVSIDTSVPIGWAAENIQQGKHGDDRKPVVVQGNLDPIALVAGGDFMVEEIHRILECLGPDRFIFNLGHGIIPQTPPDHVAQAAEIIRNWVPKSGK